MSILYDIRTKLSELSINESNAMKEQPALADIFQDIQNLQRDYNSARLYALKNVDNSFTQKLEILEKRYAFLLRLSS